MRPSRALLVGAVVGAFGLAAGPCTANSTSPESAAHGPAGGPSPTCAPSQTYKGCVHLELSGQIPSATYDSYTRSACTQKDASAGYGVVMLDQKGTSIAIGLTPNPGPGTYTVDNTVTPRPATSYQLTAGLNITGYFGGGMLDKGSLTIDSGGTTGSFDFHIKMTAFGATSSKDVEAKGQFWCPPSS